MVGSPRANKANPPSRRAPKNPRHNSTSINCTPQLPHPPSHSLRKRLSQCRSLSQGLPRQVFSSPGTRGKPSKHPQFTTNKHPSHQPPYLSSTHPVPHPLTKPPIQPRRRRWSRHPQHRSLPGHFANSPDVPGSLRPEQDRHQPLAENDFDF